MALMNLSFVGAHIVRHYGGSLLCCKYAKPVLAAAQTFLRKQAGFAVCKGHLALNC